MRAMKTVIISFYMAYPITSGAASVTYNCAKYLGGQRWLIQMGTENARATTDDGVDVITLAGTNGRVGKLLRMGRLISQIVQRCREIDPDQILLEGASWAMYHWRLLAALRRSKLRARIMYHSHNVEYLLRKVKHGRVVTQLTGWAEGRLLRNSDEAFAVSTVDQAEFERLYGVRPKLLPNGVDVEAFARVEPAEIERVRRQYGIAGKTVLFMGLCAYRPNAEAIDFLVSSVMPRVVAEIPDSRLVIIGGSSPHRAPWLINPGLLPHADLPAVVRAANIGVAPIFSGSGTRLKILECFAASRPVVATAKGAEGLDVIDRQHLLLADDANAFAEAIVSLLRDERFAEALGCSGHELVAGKYDWPTILRCLENPPDHHLVPAVVDKVTA